MNRFCSFAAVLSLGLLLVSCGTKKTSDAEDTGGMDEILSPSWLTSRRSVSEKADYEMSYNVGGQVIEMTKVPAGHFTMGLSNDNRRKVTNGLPHEVALDGFVISSRPVSKALWKEVMGSDAGSASDPTSPVDMVSWNDIRKFISKLNKVTGKTFSLPTEAQWEYAAGQLGFKGSEHCADDYSEEGDGLDFFNANAFVFNPLCDKGKPVKVIRSVAERLPLDCHTKKAGVVFRLAQATEEILGEDVLVPLLGDEVDREPANDSKGGVESFKVGGVEFKMVAVPGGTFEMGFNDKALKMGMSGVPENERGAHEVTLDTYSVGQTEVTVALWNAVMGYVPYLNDISEPQKPVGNISWYDAQEFVRKLSSVTGRKFRLPTEAEWEYAARGGAASGDYVFSGSDDSKSVMWYAMNAQDLKPRNVATKRPNELGVYDMSGNVWEWCQDRSGDYPREAVTNPLGPEHGDMRILRGGSCASRWDACRVSNRSFMPPVMVKGSFGLRLAL